MSNVFSVSMNVPEVETVQK